MLAPPACVLGCGRKFLFCRWSSTPPKNWMFLGRLLVSQNAANIAKRHTDQTRSGAPRLVGLLHRISTGSPVLCAFPPSPTAIFLRNQGCCSGLCDLILPIKFFLGRPRNCPFKFRHGVEKARIFQSVRPPTAPASGPKFQSYHNIIGKAVFICLVGSVNLVLKFQGMFFSAGWTPQNYST